MGVQQTWGTPQARFGMGATRRGLLTSVWSAARRLDPVLLLAVLGLVALGCAAIYSSTVAELQARGLPGTQFLYRQLFSLGLGLVVLLVVAALDYRRLQTWAPFLYAGAVLLLGLVLTPLGVTINGTQGWLGVGPLQFQPAELVKVVGVVTLAAVLTVTDGRPGLPRVLLSLGATGVIGGLILLQPDFGTFLAFGAVLLGMLLVAGVRVRWLLALVLVAVVGAAGLFQMDVLKDYQKQRLTAFVNPEADPDGRGFSWNYRQSLIAVGSGGLTGQGYLEGPQTSLSYVPEQHTDFVFTVIAEELGFVGAGLLLGLYALLLWRALRIAAQARDRFGTLLAGGVVALLTFSAFLNVGMTMGIMPITGIPLPFVSYGGSSLVAGCLAAGLLMSVRARSL